jgi:hypothetical protein
MRHLTGWWQQKSTHAQDIWLAVLVVVVALVPRLLNLQQFLTADEPKSWFGRSIQFANALVTGNFAATYDSPAPGVTTMWAGTLGLLLDYIRQGFPGDLALFLAKVPFDPLDPSILPLIRLPVVLVATGTALLTFTWGRQILGRNTALLAALLLALDPFLLALTRILGHDGLVTLFMWLSLLAFLRATLIGPKTDRTMLVTSGLLGGLAFLTKYPALFLGAFIAVILLVFHWRRHQTWWGTLRTWTIEILLWSVAAGAVFVFLWPAMWVDPVGRVLAIANDALRASGSAHPKGSFFFGQPVADPGTSFYLIVSLFKTTPVVLLGVLLSLITLFAGWRKGYYAEPWFKATVIFILFSVLFWAVVTAGGKKQDRYILPAFPSLAALAAIGYMYLPRITGRQSLARRLQTILGPVVVVAQFLFIFPYHPYYFTYYSPLFGGGERATQTIVVGWGEGLDQAATWLNQQPHASETDVVAWYSTTFEPFFAGNAIYKVDEEKISRTPKPGLAADYVVLYVNQLQRELPSAGALQFFEVEPPVHTVTLNGIDYAWIYPSVKLQRIISDESRLVGQAELQGFNLLDERGQQVVSLATDRATTVQLYWEWQGKMPEEPIGLALVDDQGQAWGWGHPLGTESRLPLEAWQEGMVAWDSFILTPLPGTPPGKYALKAWIDRPATGERVGDFPITSDMQVMVERPAVRPDPDALNLSARLDHNVAGGAVTLLGIEYDEQISEPWSPGEARSLRAFWQVNQQPPSEIPVLLRLIEEDRGAVRAEWPAQPVGGQFTINQWQAEDIIRDPWELVLPPYVPSGEYQLTAQIDQSPVIKLIPVTVSGRPRQFSISELAWANSTQFGKNITLLGLQGDQISNGSLNVAPGESLIVRPVWQAGGLIDTDYTITAQLLSGQEVIAQRDSMPLNGTAPTTTWAAGEIVPDELVLEIPDKPGAAPHRLLLALYEVTSGRRLLLPSGEDHLTIPVVIKN